MRLSHHCSLVAALLLTATALPAGAGVSDNRDSPASPSRVRQIPFSDWLDAQTGTLVVWTARENSKPFSPLTNTAVVDYAGARERELSLAFGFSATGSVTVRTLADGTGEVLVNVSFSNALTRISNANGDLILGYIFATLPGNPSLVPGLSNGHLHAKYIVPDPNSPQLDFEKALFVDNLTFLQIEFNSQGEGPLRAAFGVPEGTPGQCVVAQSGVFNTGGGGATADGYPAELVDVRALDNAVSAPATGSNVLSHGMTLGTADQGHAVSGSWGQLKALYREDASTK